MIRKLVSIVLFVAAMAPVASFANEAKVKKEAEKFFDNAKIDEVRKLPGLDLYEIRLGSDVAYTDEKFSYVFFGSLVDVKTKKNLTQARQRELSAIKFSDLPLGVGPEAVLDRVIVDKNARIGEGARLVNEGNIQDVDGDGYYIRSGIIVVPKNGIVKPGTVV